MKQKSAAFRNKIRKREMQEYFSQKRKAIRQSQTQQTKIIITSNKPISNQIHIESIETTAMQTTADYYQQWRQYQYNINKQLSVGSFEIMENIFRNIHHSLKKIICHQNMAKCRKNQLIENFLRTNILSYIVRTVIQAHLCKISQGILQAITILALKILDKMLNSHPKQFPQSLFLQSDLLKFIAFCLLQAKFDKSHLELIMNAIMHMITVSQASTGRLFSKLNGQQTSQFHLSAIFYNISNIILEPSEIITQNFMIMMNQYFSAIDEFQYQSRCKGIERIIPICLNSHQIDITFEITIKSVDYYIKSPLQVQQNLQCLQQSIQLLKCLVQHSQITSKWIDRINYKKLLSLLLFSTTPFQIITNVLIIIDHLIYSDPTERITQFFVKQCDLIPTIWTLKNQYFGYVINILCNLASMPQFKPQIAPYSHQIFLNLNYNPSYLLYQFIYNWFCSQDFQIYQSKDQLAIAMLRQSTQTQSRITKLESMIWFRLIENNQISVPNRILQLDNQCSQRINQILRNDWLQEEV